MLPLRRPITWVKLPDDLLRWGIERGFMNPDGTPNLPEGDPCVTLVR